MFSRVPTASAKRGLTSSGNRTSTANIAQKRAVKDISYFERIIYAKTTELRIEICRMQREIDDLQRQETAISITAKNARTLAEELTTQQDLLADLNTAILTVNVGSKLPDMQKELNELKESNDLIEKEQEPVYANRMELQMKISDMNSVMSTMQEGQAILTSSDYEAIKTNPSKLEWAKLELKIWSLRNQKESLQYKSTIFKMDDPEDEIAALFEKLASLVLNKLDSISKRAKSFPKEEQFEKFLIKNTCDFAYEDTTPVTLLVNLGLYLEQLKLIDRNMDASMRKFRDKAMDLKGVWTNTLNLADLENSTSRKKSALVNHKTKLECRNHSLQMTLDTRSAELENYRRQLMRSKDYSKICDLELKLSNYRRINYDLQEYLEEGKSLQDLQECKERTLTVVDRLNEKFKSSLDH